MYEGIYALDANIVIIESKTHVIEIICNGALAFLQKVC
jgi:hypothetical protein